MEQRAVRVLLPDGKHTGGHGGNCQNPGGGTGGTPGQRGPKCPARFPLTDYRLVIVGSPVWAGRCSSVVRSFLKENGKHIRNASYVLTRGCEDKNEEIFEQMDHYVPCGHRTAASLRSGSVGYAFWQEEFLRQTQEFLRTAGR